MSQLNNIVTVFGNNDLVTAAKLNSLVTDTTLTHEAVTNQTVSTGTLAGSDVVLGHQVTADALVKIPLSTIRGNAALGPVAASAINGVASADIVITPQAGQKVDVNGPFEANSINCVGASTVGGNQTVTGNLTVTGTSTMTGNVTASGDLTVTGSLTVVGKPVQQRVDVAILTREIASGSQHFYGTVSQWLDCNYNTISQTNPFVVNASSFTGVVGSDGTSVVTLPAGTYEFEGQVSNASGGGTGSIVARVRNDTTGVQLKKGNVGKCGGFANGESIVRHIATFAAQTNIKIQHMVAVVSHAQMPNNDGTPEQIWVLRITRYS